MRKIRQDVADIERCAGRYASRRVRACAMIDFGFDALADVADF